MQVNSLLVSGASGFLGKFIYKELLKHGKVISIARSDADINADLSVQPPILPTVELVVHCAGKAHFVPKNEMEKQAFFDTNVKGTRNLLKGIEKSGAMPKSFVLISSVAVYGLETGQLLDEKTSLLAQDAYGASKIQAEAIVRDWCEKNDVICTILRLPLIAGPNPPGNLSAMINGIKKGYYFNIAGGKAKKSMVLAQDVAEIITKAAIVGGVYNLTDGQHPSFFQLAQLIAKQLGKSKPLNIPFSVAKLMALIGSIIGNKAPINNHKLKKITSDLTFDDTKARKALGWNPKPVLQGFRIYS